MNRDQECGWLYEKTKKVTGCAAALGGAGYMVAAVIAVADGLDRGLEIPGQVGSISIALISVLGVISICMRIADHSNRASADQLSRELEAKLTHLVRAEVADALDDVSARAFRAGVVNQATQTAASMGGASLHRVPSGREA